jgi:hypothetical protein
MARLFWVSDDAWLGSSPIFRAASLASRESMAGA